MKISARAIGNNMTELFIGNTTILFSYAAPVAAHRYEWFRQHGTIFVVTEQRWCAATSRHINMWLKGAHAKSVPQSFFDDLLETAKWKWT